MAPSNRSPNRDNYPIMKGHVLFMREGTSVWRHLGNVPMFQYKPTTTTLDHFSAMEGIKHKDLIVVLTKGGEIKLRMDEFTDANMALNLMGDVHGVPAIAAFQIFTITAANNALNTETITIDGKVYTFQTVLTNVNGNVLIGVDKAATLANLSAAINLGAGAGTLYAASTTLHPTVSANGLSPLTVTAKTAGTAGNALATTDTVTNGSWGAATLTGGTNEDLTGDLTVSIFTENTIRGALRFYATNEIGPKWDFDFPGVDILPSGTTDLIGDTFGEIEITGDVVPVSGVYGTGTQLNVARAPQNLPNQTPYIVGTAKVGVTLTANEGVWRFMTAYAYQWKKGGVDIVGAVNRAYTPVIGDVGGILTVAVTAINATGSNTALSDPTVAVAA
jgi:hypothetical protein